MEQKKTDFAAMLRTAIKVVTSPAAFFREMPKTGGYKDPLLFLVVMGAATGVITVILGLFDLVTIFSAGMAIAATIIIPAVFVVFGFVGALIAFAVWKLLGSQETYESAFRCVAYIAAAMSIVAVIDVIPYIGWVAVVALVTYLYVTASTGVHKIASQKAWIVFGIIGVAVLFLGLGSEFGTRSAQQSAEQRVQEMQKTLEEMQKKMEQK